MWRLEVQLITHKEEEDDNDEYSSEAGENDEDGSNIYNLSQMSARAFLRSRGTYIYLLATFKSDLLLLIIFVFKLCQGYNPWCLMAPISWWATRPTMYYLAKDQMTEAQLSRANQARR